MVNMTLAIPEELKKKMNKFPEMNWSEVARTAFEQRVQDMEVFRKLRETSTLSEEDALILGRKVSAALTKRYREEIRKDKTRSGR
jgi:hypothetical protein